LKASALTHFVAGSDVLGAGLEDNDQQRQGFGLLQLVMMPKLAFAL
jgi:hypothetical protein